MLFVLKLKIIESLPLGFKPENIISPRASQAACQLLEILDLLWLAVDQAKLQSLIIAGLVLSLWAGQRLFRVCLISLKVAAAS